MQHTWLKRAGERDLALFVLGWASTPNAVCHIDPPGCDMLAVYDYTDLQPPEETLYAPYRRIYLFAWSFGVWVAEQLCCDLPLYKAIALNGTPFPVDERYGMRLRVVLRTMQAMARTGAPPAGAHAGEADRAMPTGPYPDRSIEAKIEELTRLAAWSRENSTARLAWDAAFIGDKDEIFPPERMWAYWRQVGLGTEFSGYHYPFADPSIVLNQLDPA